MRGNTTATDQLTRYPNTDLELGDEQDVSPLHMACVYGHIECVSLLLYAGVNVWRSVQMLDLLSTIYGFDNSEVFYTYKEIRQCGNNQMYEILQAFQNIYLYKV